MTISNNTLLILASRAPRDADQRTRSEWERQFRVDYPEPEFRASKEWADACSACNIARCVAQGRTEIFRLRFRLFYTPDQRAWMAWKAECWKKFLDDEWPLIWARRLAESLEAQ